MFMKTTTLCRSVLPVLLLATAGSHPLIAKNIDKRKHDPRLVGLWKESDYYVHTVILRTADGFYKEKHLWFKGFHKPGDFYDASGRWFISGRFYVVVLDHISDTAFASSLHKPLKRLFRSVSATEFKYISGDGADVEEVKIGDASIRSFEGKTVEPYPPDQI